MISTAFIAAVVAWPPAPAEPPCQGCHVVQAAAWAGSMHARSMIDPLYRAMRERARADVGEEAAASCAPCHSVAIDSGGRTEAVTCVACHRGRAVAEVPGGWRIAAGAPVAAPAGNGGAPHAIERYGPIAEGRLCLVCHGELHNNADLPVCTTGPEAEAAGWQTACLSCHASHEFPGAVPELLANAATLAIEPHDGAVVITVTNSGAGHALPTGPVLRQIRLEVAFLAASGRVVWDSSPDPTSVFARVLRDAAGRSPAPPWSAVGVARDNRLAPGASWTFRYSAPPSAARVRARLVYHRAPPELVTGFGLAEDPLYAPVEMLCFEENLRFDGGPLSESRPRRP